MTTPTIYDPQVNPHPKGSIANLLHERAASLSCGIAQLRQQVVTIEERIAHQERELAEALVALGAVEALDAHVDQGVPS